MHHHSFDRIFLSPPHMGGHEINYVNKAFEDNWITPAGPNLLGFEADICKFTGVKSAAALSSGTAAIHLALILLGVTNGDEVLCSTFTFSASANPIVYQGATPVFVESEAETWNMCPATLEETIKYRLEKGKKPKAIIVVHLYGMPAKMQEILEVAARYEIPIIEDAAEALGSTYKNKPAGSFGLLNVFSFNGNKIITTSGGGALLSDDEKLIEKARFLATQAKDAAPHYQHSEIGYNYRLSNISAGIGRGQMEVLEKRVKQRRDIFEAYKNNLKEIEAISFLPEPEGFYSNRWLTCILIDPASGVTTEKLRQHLETKNIEARPLWKPMHLQPVFEKYPYYGNRLSEKLFATGLCLPSGSALTEEILAVVYKEIKAVFKAAERA